MAAGTESQRPQIAAMERGILLFCMIFDSVFDHNVWMVLICAVWLAI